MLYIVEKNMGPFKSNDWMSPLVSQHMPSLSQLSFIRCNIKGLKMAYSRFKALNLHPQKAYVLFCSTYTSAKLATKPNTWSWLVIWLERRTNQFLSFSNNILQEPKTYNYLWHHAVDTWHENKFDAKQNQRSESWKIEKRKTEIKSYQP